MFEDRRAVVAGEAEMGTRGGGEGARRFQEAGEASEREDPMAVLKRHLPSFLVRTWSCLRVESIQIREGKIIFSSALLIYMHVLVFFLLDLIMLLYMVHERFRD